MAMRYTRLRTTDVAAPAVGVVGRWFTILGNRILWNLPAVFLADRGRIETFDGQAVNFSPGDIWSIVPSIPFAFVGV